MYAYINIYTHMHCTCMCIYMFVYMYICLENVPLVPRNYICLCFVVLSTSQCGNFRGNTMLLPSTKGLIFKFNHVQFLIFIAHECVVCRVCRFVGVGYGRVGRVEQEL